MAFFNLGLMEMVIIAVLGLIPLMAGLVVLAILVSGYGKRRDDQGNHFED